MQDKPIAYRKNVACVVINSEGKVLACRRADDFKTWQLPQGGVNLDETLEDAAWRELKEEIGTNEAELIGNLSESEKYEWPEELYHRGFRGQEQFYFLFKLKDTAKINLSSFEQVEFDAYEWKDVQDFIKLVNDFKRDSYKVALKKLIYKYPKYFNNSDLA